MEPSDNYFFEAEVRNNEIDLQGIVNNANYFIYMEHARYKHMKALGIDFANMHSIGYDLLLVKTEITFKASLRSGDEFMVSSQIEPNGKIRFDFIQNIVRKADGKIVTTAINTVTCVKIATGRPTIPEMLRTALTKAL